ncbi:MAG: SGNH/GDSL hydrolase family protein [Lachnospiraceae bacterium]|nr:SGNH/GDSL hydrolase family protein [Lachnospiraceae bacterium]
MFRSDKLINYPIKEVPYYHIYGRTDLYRNDIPLFWNGSGIEVNVSGSELWIELDTDCDLYEPWISTEINGAFMSRQMLLPGHQKLCLFRGLDPNTVKNVHFNRELQAMSEDDVCHIIIKGLESDGSFYPIEPKKYRLEFIGDSITSGEGTYGFTSDVDWVSMYMSSSINYAVMTSKMLNADYRLISQGGWGVYTGWDNNRNHAIPKYYDKISGLSWGIENEKLGASKLNDFSSWIPDAIIVNLGTNDASAFVQPPFPDPETGETYKQRTEEDGSYNEEDLSNFRNAVISFIKLLRKHNPSSHILWAYGMLGYDLSLPIAMAVSDYRRETGDDNVFYLQLPNTKEDSYGAHMHPGVKSHKLASEVLYDYLKSLFDRKEV